MDIYIRQIDNSVWWLCESSNVNPGWTSVANGTMEGNTVSLNWIDVPKSNLSATGSLLLNITSDNEMEIVNYHAQKDVACDYVKSRVASGGLTKPP